MIFSNLRSAINKSVYKDYLVQLYARITGVTKKTSLKKMLENSVFANFCDTFLKKAPEFKDLYLCLCEPEFRHFYVICPYGTSPKQKLFLAAEFAVILASNNMIPSLYGAKLIELSPMITNIIFISGARYPYVLEPEKIMNLYAPGKIAGRKTCYYLKTDNKFITSSIMGYVDSSDADSINNRPIMAECLERLLTDFGVENEKSVSPDLYLRIASHVTKNFPEKGSLRVDTVITALTAYVKYCIKTYKCICDSFYKCQYFSIKLLCDGKIKKYIKGGYKFMSFDRDAILKEPERVVFTRKNMERYSTKIWPNDYFSLDMKGLCTLYRRAVFSWASCLRNTVRIKDNLGIAIKALRILQNLKNISGEKERTVNMEEISVIVFDNPKGLKDKLHDEMYILRAFFNYVHGQGILDIDGMALMLLEPRKKPEVSGGHAADQNWLCEANNILASKNKEDPYLFEFVHYVAFRICLILPLRISQILSLREENIRKREEDKYVLVDESKTSRGNAISYPITASTADLLYMTIEKTEEIRKRCTNPDASKFIFIYWSVSYNGVKVASKNSFNRYLKNNGIINPNGEYLSPTILRSTLITTLRMWCEKKKVPPMYADAVTCHTDNRAVFNNYYDSEYAGQDDVGYEIKGDFNQNIDKTKKSISSFFIKEAFNPEDCVFKENGFKCPFTCLICEHFVASKDSIPLFKKNISDLQLSLKSITDESDRNEIMLLIELLNKYLFLLEAE